MALMYTAVSREYIFPGLHLCDQLSVEAAATTTSAQSSMTAKLDALIAFTNNAHDNIQTQVKAVSPRSFFQSCLVVVNSRAIS
jgi:hypothetical protein